MNKDRRSVLKVGGLFTGGFFVLSNDVLRADITPNGLRFSAGERDVLRFAAEFSGAACYYGGCIAGNLNPGERKFADLAVRIDDHERFVNSLTGEQRGLPFDQVYASGNTLSFAHRDGFFTLEVLAPADFASRLADIQAGRTSIFAHDGLTCATSAPTAIEDPLDARNGSAGGRLRLNLLENRAGLGLPTQFEQLLNGLLDVEYHNVASSTEFAEYEREILSRRVDDQNAAGLVMTSLLARLSPLGRVVASNILQNLMATPLVESAASAFGKPPGREMAIRYQSLRSGLPQRFTNGAVWLAIVLESEINSGKADGLVWSRNRYAHLQSREDLALAKEIVAGVASGEFGEIGTGLTTPGSIPASSFADWSAEHFGSEGSPTGDYDNDGIPDLLEYALGMDPTVASQIGLPTSSLQTIDGTEYFTLNYQKDLSKTDIAYTVQSTADFREDSWATAGIEDSLVEAEGGIEQRVARAPMDSPRRFLRLFVEMK